jgi:hypothetical protein
MPRLSGVVIATLVILIVFFVVLTYISWGTDVGISLRYYYYLTAIFTLSLVLTLLGLVITENQRRSAEENQKLMKRVLITQDYWIGLEKVFLQQSPQLNRLYKQMWPSIPEIQSIPDPIITPEIQMQELHAASMILGMIHNVNETVTWGEKPQNVLLVWKQPQYNGFYQALSNWMKSEILWRRWLQSGHHSELHMEIFMNHLRNNPIL